MNKQAAAHYHQQHHRDHHRLDDLPAPFFASAVLIQIAGHLFFDYGLLLGWRRGRRVRFIVGRDRIVGDIQRGLQYTVYGTSTTTSRPFSSASFFTTSPIFDRGLLRISLRSRSTSACRSSCRRCTSRCFFVALRVQIGFGLRRQLARIGLQVLRDRGDLFIERLDLS